MIRLKRSEVAPRAHIAQIVNSLFQSPHLNTAKKAKLSGIYRGSSNPVDSANTLLGGFISSPMHESPLIEISSAKEQEQRGNTTSPFVDREM